MSVVVADPAGKTQMITKGAIEEMLNISKFIDLGGTVTPLTKERKEAVLAKVQSLNEDGLRVIGVAQKTNPSVVGEFSVKDESDMVLIGYLAFLDPPKETTETSVESSERTWCSCKSSDWGQRISYTFSVPSSRSRDQ